MMKKNKDKWWTRRMLTRETEGKIMKIVFMLGIVFFVAMTGTWILPQLREGGMVRNNILRKQRKGGMT